MWSLACNARTRWLSKNRDTSRPNALPPTSTSPLSKLQALLTQTPLFSNARMVTIWFIDTNLVLTTPCSAVLSSWLHWTIAHWLSPLTRFPHQAPSRWSKEKVSCAMMTLVWAPNLRMSVLATSTFCSMSNSLRDLKAPIVDKSLWLHSLLLSPTEFLVSQLYIF